MSDQVHISEIGEWPPNEIPTGTPPGDLAPVPQVQVEAIPPAPPETDEAKMRRMMMEVIAPLKSGIENLTEQNKALQEENKRLQFELQNAPVRPDSLQPGVYRGRPDTARHVTLATRPVMDAPQEYNHPVGGLGGSSERDPEWAPPPVTPVVVVKG